MTHPAQVTSGMRSPECGTWLRAELGREDRDSRSQGAFLCPQPLPPGGLPPAQPWRAPSAHAACPASGWLLACPRISGELPRSAALPRPQGGPCLASHHGGEAPAAGSRAALPRARRRCQARSDQRQPQPDPAASHRLSAAAAPPPHGAKGPEQGPTQVPATVPARPLPSRSPGRDTGSSAPGAPAGNPSGCSPKPRQEWYLPPHLHGAPLR